MLFVLCNAYIILHNVFNTFNGLSHSCLSGSFEIAKVKIEGQMQKRSFGCWWTTYWLATSGNLRRPPWRHAMTCHDMPWHAMTCHDMPSSCFGGVRCISTVYISVQVWTFWLYESHLAGSVSGTWFSDSGLFPCYYDLLSRDPDVTGT